MGRDDFIDENLYREVFGKYFESDWERSIGILKKYGHHLAFDVITVLMCAIDKEKEDEVFALLEEHWERHLQFQHPDVRGRVKNEFGINETEKLLHEICAHILYLRVPVI